MKNDIVGFMSHITIRYLSENIKESYGGTLNVITNKIKERCSDIKIHVKSDTSEASSPRIFSEHDCIIVYFNNSDKCYHCGKWSDNTIQNTEGYSYKQKCGSVFQLAEYLTNHIKQNNTYSNENRLQKEETVGPDRVQRQGVAINVERVQYIVKTGLQRNGEVITR